MNSLEESFKTGMAMFWVMLLTATCESYRPEIEPELGTILGRKPTDDEWHYFLRECIKKAHAGQQQKQFRQWLQNLAGRKIIHDFVWKGE